ERGQPRVLRGEGGAGASRRRRRGGGAEPADGRLRRRLPRPVQPPREPRGLGGGAPRAPRAGPAAGRAPGELQRQRRGAAAPGRGRGVREQGAGPARGQARVPGGGEAVLSRRRDVIVVGGGVAGLTLAHELSRRGAHVTLVERTAAPAGASAVPAALLNPYRGRTARARPTDLAGLEAFWRLARTLEEEGLDPGARATGVLRVAPSPRQAALWREVAAAAGDGTRWLAPDEVPDGVHAPHGALLA